MKILRSVKRRGFSVGSAGWFTVLRPDTWSPVSRLPSSHRRLGIQTRETTEQMTEHSAPKIANDQVSAVPWQVFEQNEQPRHPMRSASIVLAALVITAAMLWWVMHP